MSVDMLQSIALVLFGGGLIIQAFVVLVLIRLIKKLAIQVQGLGHYTIEPKKSKK